MHAKIYPIFDKDVTDVPFPKAKTAKSIPALTNPTTLDSLPAELLLKILSYISSSRSALIYSEFQSDPTTWEYLKNPNAELWSLCLTNRYLNYVSEPVLYQEFHHTLWTSPALVYFLRAIFRRPHLASQVKRIRLNHIKRFDTAWYTRSTPPMLLVDKDDVQLFLQTARKSLLMSEVDEKQIWRLEDSALVLLLFSQASNLRELHYNVYGDLLIESGTDFINDAFWDMLRSHRQQLDVFPFSSLRKATLSCVNLGNIRRFPLNKAAAWLFLPSVESLNLSRCIMRESFPSYLFTGGQNYGTLHKSLSPVASLTSITFRESEVDMDALYDMLSHCKSLKSFDFEWGDSKYGSNQVDYGKVGRALRTQKHSLETLRLDVIIKATDDSYLAYRDYSVEKLGSLQNFEKLSYVDVPAPAILGSNIPRDIHEIIPPNIQTLKIRSLFFYFTREIKELARVASESFRSLLLVEIGILGPNLPDYFITECVEFFDERGVTLVIKELAVLSK